MAGKLPPDAFEYYFSLGQKRSYEAVAEKYGVSKRSVVKRAIRDAWQRRLADIEARARERVTEKAVETREEVMHRHLRAFRAVELKALDSLKTMRFESALEVVKALEIAARQARLALGEPSERTAVSVEETIKREYQHWLLPASEAPSPEERAG